MELKLVSWNVFIFNKKIDDAFEFIRTLDFDILFLQEVPDGLLERLRTLPYHLASATDTIFVTDAWHPERGETPMRIAILSRYPIETQTTYRYEELPVQDKLRTKLLHLTLRLIGWWKGGTNRGREALSADMTIAGRKVRMICAHLSVMTKQARLAELALVLGQLATDRANIVAGDLNILEHGVWRWWNWFQGGDLSEALPWNDERKEVETRFKEAGLMNPLHGRMTAPITLSQLDHILVPVGSKIREREVMKERHGSDHNPIRVTIDLDSI